MHIKNIKSNFDFYSRKNIDPHLEPWSKFCSFTLNKTILFIFELLAPNPEILWIVIPVHPQREIIFCIRFKIVLMCPSVLMISSY